MNSFNHCLLNARSVGETVSIGKHPWRTEVRVYYWPGITYRLVETVPPREWHGSLPLLKDHLKMASLHLLKSRKFTYLLSGLSGFWSVEGLHFLLPCQGLRGTFCMPSL